MMVAHHGQTGLKRNSIDDPYRGAERTNEEHSNDAATALKPRFAEFLLISVERESGGPPKDRFDSDEASKRKSQSSGGISRVFPGFLKV
jgi:hypothetical protein